MEVPKNSILLGQVNIQNLSNRSKTALDNYIYSQKLDIVAIQETKQSLNDNVEFSNMRGFSIPATNGSGGCCLFFSDIWDGVCQIYFDQDGEDQTDSSTRPQTIWAIVNCGQTKLIVGTAYIPPEQQNDKKFDLFLEECNLAEDFASKNKLDGVIIAGDFNARSTHFEDTSSNDRGNKLFLALQESDLSIISPGEKTFSRYNGGSVIDLVITSDNLVSNFIYTQVDTESELFTGAPNMGHFPVLNHFKILNKPKKPATKVRYNLSKCDWKKWSSNLDNNCTQLLHNCNTVSDPTELWIIFRDAISKTNEETMEILKISPHSKPFWNDELTSLHNSVKQYRKKYKKHNSYFNGHLLSEAKHDFSNAIQKYANEWIQAQAKSMDRSNNSSFWKKYKQVFKKPGNPKIEVLNNPENPSDLFFKDAEKATLLKESFFSGNHLKDLQADEAHDKIVNEEVDRILSEEPPNTQDHINSPITLDEINLVTNNLQTEDKSLDNDGIHPLMAKNCGTIAKKILVRLYNESLNLGYWPWTSSKVIFIRKPNKKTYTDPSSYRPITLSSIIGKVFEKIIAWRLEDAFRSSGNIHKSQEGFLKGRNTTRYLYRLKLAINTARKLNKPGIALMIDFEKAFDSVWIKGLLYKLHRAGIRGRLWHLIASFLQNRTLNLIVNDFIQECSGLIFGLPQGSVLSPILFIFYISDILSDRWTEALYKFADDMSIFMIGENLKEAETNLKSCCMELENWCFKWKLKINTKPGKTEALIIAKDKEYVPTITICGQNIACVDNSPVLGLYIDNKLDWKKQTAVMMKKLWAAWIPIKKFALKSRALKSDSIIYLVKTCLLTKLLYAAPVWLNECHSSFNAIFYDVLKVATGTEYNPSKDLLQCCLNFCPIEIESSIVTVKFLIKNIYQPYYWTNCDRNDLARNLINAINMQEPKSLKDNILMKKYIKFQLEQDNMRNNPRSLHSLNIEEELDKIYYTKKTIEEFKYKEWELYLASPMNDAEKTDDTLSPIRRLVSFPGSRAREILLFRLLTGKNSLRYFLNKLDKSIRQYCINCGDAPETADHIIFHCRLNKFPEERDILKSFSSSNKIVETYIEAAHERNYHILNCISSIMGILLNKRRFLMHSIYVNVDVVSLVDSMINSIEL